MLAFIVRRLIGMVLVLVAVSFLVFVIFIVVPGGDPAVRIAGKNANDQLIHNIRHTWGFDRPFYVQYVIMMKKTFSGELKSYTNQTNVLDQIKQGLPATFSLSIGAALIWTIFGVAVGVLAAVRAGKLSDRLVTILALVGISMPVFWLGIIVRYYLAEGGLTTFFPDGEYVGLLSRTQRSGPGTCCCRGSCSPCSSSASTAACCARTSSTRSTRTTCARRAPRASTPAR